MQNWEIDTRYNKGYYLLSENPKENVINFKVTPDDYECVGDKTHSLESVLKTGEIYPK